MAELKRLHVFDGRELLSDKAVRSIEGPLVIFSDGSRCNLATGGMTQYGSGTILVRSLRSEQVNVTVSDAIVRGDLIIQADASGVSVMTTGPAVIPAQTSLLGSIPRRLPWYERFMHWLKGWW